MRAERDSDKKKGGNNPATGQREGRIATSVDWYLTKRCVLSKPGQKNPSTVQERKVRTFKRTELKDSTPWRKSSSGRSNGEGAILEKKKGGRRIGGVESNYIQ